VPFLKLVGFYCWTHAAISSVGPYFGKQASALYSQLNLSNNWKYQEVNFMNVLLNIIQWNVLWN
jgi:hypothetical protein